MPPNAPSPLVIALVATFRRPALLTRLLESLQGIQIPLLVRVVDNADDPETEAALAAFQGRLQVQRLIPGANLGCGGGLEFGEREVLAQHPDATHFWILDDDAVVAPGALERMLAAMDAHGAIFACPTVLDHGGGIDWIPGALQRKAFRVLKSRGTHADYLARCGPAPVGISWAAGISQLLTREALERLGLHRSDFWIRGEDIEFSLRFTYRDQGIFVPEAVVHHLSPSPQASPQALEAERKKELCMLRNHAYIALHLPHGRRILSKLPGNLWRFIQAFGWRRLGGALHAIWQGGALKLPAGIEPKICREASRSKLVVFAHTPPPHHGQSFMVKLMLEGLQGGPIECHHVNCRVSDGMEDIGSVRWGKGLLLLRHCLQAIWCRMRHGVRTLYYVPAPGKRSALYRDWVVMALCRPFFPRVILHWHASGLGAWLDTQGTRLERGITQVLLGRPALSIALAEASSQDAAWVRSRRVVIVPNGIPDPCPAFESALRPHRQRRAAECRERMCRPADFPLGVQALFLAHCTREKGLFDTLEGVALFNQSQNALRVHLTVAGAFMDEGEERAFRDRLARPDLAGAVTFAGFVSGPEKQRLLEQTDCLCFPSYYAAESFPITLVEALAFGIPCIATRWRAIPEMLPADYPGFVDARSPAQIAEAFGRLLGGPEMAQDLRERYLAQFSLPNHLAKLATALTLPPKSRFTDFPVASEHSQPKPLPKTTPDPGRPLNILITEAYTDANVGSAALVENTLKLLRQRFPSAHFRVMAVYPEAFQSRYGVESVADPFQNPYQKPLLTKIKWALKTVWWTTLVRLQARKGVQKVRFYPSKLEHYLWADWVVSVHAERIKESFHVDALYTLFSFHIAHLLGKKVILFPCTLGPYGRGTRPLVNRWLREVDLLFTRDQRSFELAHETEGLAPEKIVYCPDVATIQEAIGRSEALALIGCSPDDSLVGVSVMRWRYIKGEVSPYSNYASYVAEMAKLIDHLTATYGVKVVLYPTNYALHGCTTEDRDAVLEIYAACERKERVVKIERFLSPAELKGALACSEVNITTRMHACIFSTGAGVPTLSVNYLYKLQEYMKALGLADFGIDIEYFNAEWMQAAFEKMWHRRVEIRQQLQDRLEHKKALLHSKMDLLCCLK